MKPFSKQKFWAPESRPLVSLVPLELRVCLNVSARLQEFRRCFFGDCLEGKEECYGYVDPTTGKPIYSEAGFELCDVGVKHSSVTLVRCSEGNSGTMCSQCKSDYFKGLPWEGHKCLECPSPGIGIFLYTFMPFFWVFLFFPGIRSGVPQKYSLTFVAGIKYIIGGKITPSLFVSLPFVQLSALVGTFGFQWSKGVKTVLTFCKVVSGLC